MKENLAPALHHKTEHVLDARVRETENIVGDREAADLTVAPEATYTSPLVGEAIQVLAGTEGAVSPAAAPYEQDELTDK